MWPLAEVPQPGWQNGAAVITKPTWKNNVSPTSASGVSSLTLEHMEEKRSHRGRRTVVAQVEKVISFLSHKGGSPWGAGLTLQGRRHRRRSRSWTAAGLAVSSSSLTPRTSPLRCAESGE